MYSGTRFDMRQKDHYKIYTTLINGACERTGLSQYTILKSRKRKHKYYRYAILWWMRKRMYLSYPKIAKSTDFNHASIIHVFKLVDGTLKVPQGDPELYEGIMQEIETLDNLYKKTLWKL